MAIRFGTSGWRAVFADEFTFNNVRRLVHCIAGHAKESADFGFPSKDYRQQAGQAGQGVAPTVVVGYDPRFQGEAFAAEAATVFAQDGVRVLLSKGDVPTPATAWAILENKAVGGVMITASHNPARYNGVKWSPYWAGPATPAVTEDIERRLGILPPGTPRVMAYDRAARDGWIAETDFRPGYYKQLKSLLDPKALKNSRLKVGVDAMGGAARTYLRPFLDGLGLKTWGLREDRDVLFGGVSPEPAPEKLTELAALMKKEKLDLGLACDGDADRFGVLDRGGEWIPANEVLALALHHLVKNRGMSGGVARSLMTSHFVDAVAKGYGLRVRETPVGFKYIGDLLRGGEFVLGGEESAGLSIRGHVPEKDGLLAGLLMAELVAFEKKPLVKVRDELFRKFGSHHNTRLNYELEGPKLVRELNERLRVKPPTTLAGASVWRIDDSDGFKFILKDGRWLGLRFSGTEPVVRLYAEARDEKGLAAMVDEGKHILKGKK
ncbi:MAG: phosphoglucomutase/phosphomannomutase family protein [Elusimicrobia bacterium]|nr:phosphoglucomutase/phosphomannomutase family protein [Elusimicrobiota bacterium]